MQVRTLNPQGVAAWWQGGHPGWAIYPVDSDHFMSSGALDSLSVPTDDVSTPASPGARRPAPIPRTRVPFLGRCFSSTAHPPFRSTVRKRSSMHAVGSTPGQSDDAAGMCVHGREGRGAMDCIHVLLD